MTLHKSFYFCLLLVSFFSIQNTFSQSRPLIADDYEAQSKWVDSIYAGMSLQEEVGQVLMVDVFFEFYLLFQINEFSIYSGPDKSLSFYFVLQPLQRRDFDPAWAAPCIP